jgi:FtsP/CotA-like multicopper oxidase with cupredoxin domain
MRTNALCRALALSCALLLAEAAAQDFTITAAPGTVEIAPGRSASAWLYDGRLPGPMLRVREGQPVRVRFVNRLPEESTIHWHGLPVLHGADGVPGVSRPSVPPGQEFTYEFVAAPAGTYFFHPHVGLQLDRGLYGVLIVEPAGPGDPPFDREIVLVLDDLLSGPPVPGREPVYSDWLINGRTSAGQTPTMVRSGDRVRVRFVNASAATHYVVAIDGHPMTVTHADGQRVRPVSVQALPIAAGERYDVLVNAANPGTWSVAAARIGSRNQTLVRAVLQYEGSTQPVPAPGYVPPFLSSGSLLAYSQLAAADPVPPIRITPDRTYALTLSGNMFNYVWTINGEVFPNAAPLPVRDGEAVRLSFTNMSMERHPMHLHGHFFRLLNTAGGATAPPVKDTLLVNPMMMGQVAVEFLADNPGTWAMHCHQIYHQEAGMMRLMPYVGGDRDLDGLADDVDQEPRSAWPVLTTDDRGGGYAIGTTFGLHAQWMPGTSALFFLGFEAMPIDLGEPGVIRLWPPGAIGASTTGPVRLAVLAVPIPDAPGLRGQALTFQAVLDHPSLPPGARLSTAAVVRFP